MKHTFQSFNSTFHTMKRKNHCLISDVFAGVVKFPMESLDISIGANCVTVLVEDIKRCTLSDGVGKQE